MSRPLESFEESLAACDAETSFAGIEKTFELRVVPCLESMLSAPLKAPVSALTPPSEWASPVIAEARRVVSAYDDVKYFTMRAVAVMLKQFTTDTSVNPVVRGKRMRRPKRVTRPSDLEAILGNIFCLCYGLKIVESKDGAAVRIRWPCLSTEKKAIEASEAYSNANAAERRAMQLSTVLAVFSERGRRNEFSALWVTFAACDLSADMRLHFLTNATTHILPFLTNPIALSDFLTTSVASGGLSAILALDGLLLLMLKHGLEYPSFYDKLYALVTADMFSSRHRHKLFQLLNLALSSTRVSAEIVASFIKRIARVLLVAPTPVLHFALPFLRQLFQRHPNCLKLIHRVEGDAGSEKLFDGQDPFDPFANRIADSHALESTLWELCILERHYLPGIGLMVAAYASPAQDHGQLKFDKTYGRLFAQEITRATSAGVIAYKAPDVSGTLLGMDHKESGIAGVFTV